MHHPMEHRRQDEAGDADEQQSAIDGVEAGEDLTAIGRGLAVRPHAPEDHRRRAEGFDRAHALEIAIADHADDERDENDGEAKRDIDGKPPREGPARGERLPAMFEPREEPR